MALLPHSFLEGFVTGLFKDSEEDSSSKIWHKEELIVKESDQVGYSEEKSRPKVWQIIIKKLKRRKGRGPKDYKDL